MQIGGRAPSPQVQTGPRLDDIIRVGEEATRAQTESATRARHDLERSKRGLIDGGKIARMQFRSRETADARDRSAT